MWWVLTPVIVAVWYGLGVWGGGYYLAYTQREYSELADLMWESDRRFCLTMACFGLMALLSLSVSPQEWRSYGWINPLKRTRTL